MKLKCLENKITYGELTQDNVNLIIDKAKSKNDGIYSFRGILFKVRDGKVTNYACGGKIFAGVGAFVTPVGSYNTSTEAKSKLKTI